MSDSINAMTFPVDLHAALATFFPEGCLGIEFEKVCIGQTASQKQIDGTDAPFLFLFFRLQEPVSMKGRFCHEHLWYVMSAGHVIADGHDDFQSAVAYVYKEWHTQFDLIRQIPEEVWRDDLSATGNIAEGEEAEAIPF